MSVVHVPLCSIDVFISHILLLTVKNIYQPSVLLSPSALTQVNQTHPSLCEEIVVRQLVRKAHQL